MLQCIVGRGFIPRLPGCIPCTKVRRSSAWSFENRNIIYNKSWRTITNLRRELYMECTLARLIFEVVFDVDFKIFDITSNITDIVAVRISTTRHIYTGIFVRNGTPY